MQQQMLRTGCIRHKQSAKGVESKAHSFIRQHSGGPSRSSSGWGKLPEPGGLLGGPCCPIHVAGLALVGRHVRHVRFLLTLQHIHTLAASS